MKVRINESECIGCGLCEGICPKVFAMDQDSSLAVVRDDADFESNREGIMEAADSCPVGAIEVED